MKKILAISGSARKKGIGIQVLDMFKENFPAREYAFETIHLSDYDIRNCRGCTVCFKMHEDKCPLKDDLSAIVEKVEDAHGLVFATPIYEMNVSGVLKTFLDRTAYMLHRPRLYTKHSFIIVSTDVAGVKPISAYMKYMMNAYGINNTGAVGALSYQMNSSESYRAEIRNKLVKEAEHFKAELNRGEHYQPKFTQIVRFNAWKIKNNLSKDIYPEDARYWVENGWTESDYYYPIKINPIQRVLLKGIRARLTMSLRSKIM